MKASYGCIPQKASLKKPPKPPNLFGSTNGRWVPLAGVRPASLLLCCTKPFCQRHAGLAVSMSATSACFEGVWRGSEVSPVIEWSRVLSHAASNTVLLCLHRGVPVTLLCSYSLATAGAGVWVVEELDLSYHNRNLSQTLGFPNSGHLI